MKNKFHTFLGTAILSCLIFSCKPKIDAPNPNKGNVDVTRFVAIGNTMSAGFADGALYNEAQENSFVNILAGQFKLIGGGNFKQPLISSGSVGVDANGNAPFKLGYSTDCLGATSLAPIPTTTVIDASTLSTSVYSSQGPFNNIGVPNAKVINAVQTGYGNSAQGAGNYNPFFYRMAANTASSSMLTDAQAANATFFSVMIGNDDVLAYAQAGAASDAITPSSGITGIGFDASMNTIVNTLTANGAKGVIANVPDVYSLPYFTTIPYNGLTLRQGQADSLNNALGGLFVFQAGNNPFVIEDTAVPFIGSRLIVAGELILLDAPLDKIKCNGMGSLTPIPDKYVLTLAEISNIQNATATFNATIKNIADTKGLAFVDANTFFKSLQKGIVYNGIALNTSFVTGGAFSLDGMNLNPIGNALLANEFIKAINLKFGSLIPQVDATKYRGVIFP